MAEVLVIPTEQDGLILRQLATEADDVAYFEAVDTNRDHLSQFGDTTAEKYQTPEAVAAARLNAGNKVRMGIYDGDTFVGTANASPGEQGVEIGYWLDSRNTGCGYATLAARALSAHFARTHPRVYAEVTEGNDASVRVLERAGFIQAAHDAGRLVFEYVVHDRPSKVALADSTGFEREGFDGHVYVPKEAGRGFTALQIDVHGRHPRKRILLGTTRTYYVVDGEGTFAIGDETHAVAKGDFFMIPPGGEYEYQGDMTLFEVNVSADNTFRDEKLE